MRGEEAREKDEKEARRKSPKEWLELAELGRRYHRTMVQQHEELRRAAAMLSDEHAEFRTRITRVILPGLQSDTDELRRLIRRTELYAEYSGKSTSKSRSESLKSARHARRREG